MTETAYLAHHGVKGMKWGVRKERRAANKARKKALKEAYKKELKNPGSQSEKKISTAKLRGKRTKNLLGTVLLGRECIADLAAAGSMAVSIGNAVAFGSASGYGTAALASALAGPAAFTVVAGGVGIAAGKGAIETYRRTRSLDQSISIREKRQGKAKR